MFQETASLRSPILQTLLMLQLHIKPIKVLLDANRVPIHWKSLHKLLPRREAKSKDRAYTREKLQKMLRYQTISQTKF